MISRLALLLLVLLAGACASAARGPLLTAPAPAPYRLGPGDEVRVTVFGLDAVNNSYIVGDTGAIALPLLPPVPAAGKSVDELQAALAAAIRDRQLVREPSVSVQVQRYRPFFILGEVQRPGQYPYVPGMTVLTAVSIAGGYTFRAETKRVTLQRAGGLERGAASPDMVVLPGDTINVHEAWF